jgi:hypothetical protein
MIGDINARRAKKLSQAAAVSAKPHLFIVQRLGNLELMKELRRDEPPKHNGSGK